MSFVDATTVRRLLPYRHIAHTARDTVYTACVRLLAAWSCCGVWALTIRLGLWVPLA